MLTDDRQLEASEVEKITGIESRHYTAQANKLKREGIKCVVNARKEVVVWLSWVQLAGVSQIVIGTQEPQKANNDELELDFTQLRSVDNGRQKKRQAG